MNSTEEAVQKIVQHLQNSPAHGLNEADALLLMGDHQDCAQEEDWPETSQPSQQPASHRYQPYETKGGKGKGKGKGDGGKPMSLAWQHEVLPSSGSGVVVVGSAPLTALQLRLEQQTSRCEQAAKAAAKFARAAACAFDDEAGTLRELLDEIRRAV